MVKTGLGSCNIGEGIEEAGVNIDIGAEKFWTGSDIAGNERETSYNSVAFIS